MRIALLTVGVLASGVLALALLRMWDVSLPPIGPDVETLCADAMRRSQPDLSWVAPGDDAKVRGRPMKHVTLGELPLRNGDLVRVAGVLHVDYEWSGLYPSRAALEEGWRAPWISFDSLWPSEQHWFRRAPAISDRCVAVEGIYAGGQGGHFGMFSGVIRALRLDVWVTPYRPLISTSRGPAPPAVTVR